MFCDNGVLLANCNCIIYYCKLTFVNKYCSQLYIFPAWISMCVRLPPKHMVMLMSYIIGFLFIIQIVSIVITLNLQYRYLAYSPIPIHCLSLDILFSA